MTINQVFDTGSKQLQEFISKYPIGGRVVNPHASWTVVSVDQDDTILPNPQTGQPSTLVVVTLRPQYVQPS